MSPGEVGDSTLCTDSCFPYPTLIAVSVLDFIVSGPALFLFLSNLTLGKLWQEFESV